MDNGKLANQLQRHEGLRLKPYRDSVGKFTIGVGRNLDDRGISLETAMQMLDEDIALICADLDRELPWWRDLSENRQLVLADMCFNLGIGGLKRFKKTLRLVEAGDYAEAADEMLRSKWAKQVKGRAIRLSRMMREG